MKKSFVEVIKVYNACIDVDITSMPAEDRRVLCESLADQDFYPDHVVLTGEHTHQIFTFRS